MSDTGPVGNVGDLVGRYFIDLTCSSCQHWGRFDPADLVRDYGNISTWSLISRAVCKRCGARWPDLRLGVGKRVDGSDGPRRMQ